MGNKIYNCMYIFIEGNVINCRNQDIGREHVKNIDVFLRLDFISINFQVTKKTRRTMSLEFSSNDLKAKIPV